MVVEQTFLHCNLPYTMLQVASYENSKMEIHIVSDFSEAYLGESAVITTFKLYLGFYTFTS